jgi:hypothetical protein
MLPLLLALAGDTLHVRRAERPPVLDGRADAAEYGAPDIRIANGQGTVLVWIRRAGDSVVIAAQIPDTSYYWGDDFVVSLDPRGDRSAAPDEDDTEWYVRRATDSSVVLRGRAGRWMPPGADPDWRLGGVREGESWQLRTASTAAGWSVELVLDVAWLGGDAGRLPAIAIRTYDDGPAGWWSWPMPPTGRPATVVERSPPLWVAVSLR